MDIWGYKKANILYIEEKELNGTDLHDNRCFPSRIISLFLKKFIDKRNRLRYNNYCVARSDEMKLSK